LEIPTIPCHSSAPEQLLKYLNHSYHRWFACLREIRQKAYIRNGNVSKLRKIINVHNWNFLGLDEWIGLGKTDEGSCRFMLNRDLFQPLDIGPEKICCFDGVTTNTTAECDRIENYIRQHTAIDVAVLGLGMNGHIGLNEPGTSPSLRSHVSEIHPVTKEVGQKYFSSPQHLHRGITLGIATLMEARHVILIVSGSKKASILQHALEGEITPELPASLLRNHANFMVFADNEAAGLLRKQ
jgi:galactosamine-6-phosphate isomerase